MFGLIVRKALFFDRARTGRVILSVALGAAVTTSVLGVSIGVGDQVDRELRSYGANIEITSAAPARPEIERGGVRYRVEELGPGLPVKQIDALKTVFWRHNIVGAAPFLSSTVDIRGRSVPLVGTWFSRAPGIANERSTVGVRSVAPWWRVTGRWPDEEPADGDAPCLIGSDLAQDLQLQVGSTLDLPQRVRLRISGILHTGGPEEQEIVAPLNVVQRIAARGNTADRIDVSALIKPDDSLAHKPLDRLTDAEREQKACSPYLSTIIAEIQGVMPGASVQPVYRVADTEGRLLGRLQTLMSFVLVAALLASVLGAGSAAAAAAIQRRREFALVRALGAPATLVMGHLSMEAGVLGLLGGLLGVPLGLALHRWIGLSVFQTSVPIAWVSAPVGLVLALAVAALASFLPTWSALQLDPVTILGDEQG